MCEQLGTITALDCSNYTLTGQLLAIEEAKGISLIINYTGGNGGYHDGQEILSSGTTGYTATLDASRFANGNGTLTYSISGVPQVANSTTLNNAEFLINIGTQSCSVSIPLTCYSLIKPTTVREVMNPITGKTWMDRNLGASRAATSSTDPQAYGDLYQWGRFSDGHQCRWSSITTTLSTVDAPLHGDFVTVLLSPNNWRNPENNALWQGINGPNNPCPIGYRLPTETELNEERLTWASLNNAGAFASNLRLTAAGGRSSTTGGLLQTGSRGYYLSSSINTLNFNNVTFLFIANSAYMEGTNRAFGRSVRCIKN